MAAISIGVHNHTASSGSSTTIAAGALATTTGRALIAAIENSGSTVASIADTAGNTWVSAGALSTNTNTVEIWYAGNISGNAANIVTVTYAASTIARRVQILEVAGLATTSPLDQADGANTGSSTSFTTSSVTTTATDEILIGGMAGDTTTWTAGSGYTISDQGGATGMEYRIVNSTGSYVADGTNSPSTTWAVSIATFKQAAAPVVSNHSVIMVGL